jgi:hypothetical protein
MVEALAETLAQLRAESPAAPTPVPAAAAGVGSLEAAAVRGAWLAHRGPLNVEVPGGQYPIVAPVTGELKKNRTYVLSVYGFYF